MRVRIDVSPNSIDLTWNDKRHRVSPFGLARLREIGRVANILMTPHAEQDRSLREAGAVLWSCTLGEAAVSLGRPVEIDPPRSGPRGTADSKLPNKLATSAGPYARPRPHESVPPTPCPFW
jgi:hypothetical protein